MNLHCHDCEKKTEHTELRYTYEQYREPSEDHYYVDDTCSVQAQVWDKQYKMWSDKETQHYFCNACGTVKSRVIL